MSRIDRLTRTLVASLGIGILVTGCGGGSASNAIPSNASPPPPSLLSISATPSTSATVGQLYTLQPTVSNASGSVSYSASGLPSWLTINASSGLVSGTPTSSDLGTDPGIIVTASSGSQTASLPSFSITVSAAAQGTGSASLSWTIPTQNADGSTLTDLAGFVILYGQSAQNLNQQASISNPTVSSYQVDNLASGTWYFAIVSVNSSGVQSIPTNVASVSI